jgi:hypothetical protein
VAYARENQAYHLPAHKKPLLRGENMKREKKGARRSRQPRRKLQFKAPKTARQYHAMSQKEQETWDSVAHVISRMRDGVSLPKASKEFGIAPTIVVKLGRPALRIRNGRYVATKTDRLLRVVTILGIKGKYEIATRDSRQASLVGSHWAAVQRYLQTGDDTALLKLKNKRVTDANRRRHRFLTNLEELDRLASAGVLSFETMYAGGAL